MVRNKKTVPLIATFICSHTLQCASSLRGLPYTVIKNLFTTGNPAKKNSKYGSLKIVRVHSLKYVPGGI